MNGRTHNSRKDNRKCSSHLIPGIVWTGCLLASSQVSCCCCCWLTAACSSLLTTPGNWQWTLPPELLVNSINDDDQRRGLVVEVDSQAKLVLFSTITKYKSIDKNEDDECEWVMASQLELCQRYYIGCWVGYIKGNWNFSLKNKLIAKGDILYRKRYRVVYFL